MSNANDTFHYGFHCVAFLDILGQRRKLRQLPRLPRKDEETTKLLAETAGYVRLLREHLSNLFEEFQKPSEPLAVLPKYAQDRILDARRAVKYRGFSDSIIMDVPFQGDEEQFAPMTGVFGCMAACSMLHFIALSYKRPIRGGIDVGAGLELTEGEVYGPVLEHAHFLESVGADYPRVLVGNELSHYLDEIEKHPAATPLGRTAQNLATRCKKFITVDTDGLRMLDFLGQEMSELGEPEQRQTMFRSARDYVKEQTEIAHSKGDNQYLSRYERLGAYFDKRSRFWG